jgi:hypothetical protein
MLIKRLPMMRVRVDAIASSIYRLYWLKSHLMARKDGDARASSILTGSTNKHLTYSGLANWLCAADRSTLDHGTSACLESASSSFPASA